MIDTDPRISGDYLRRISESGGAGNEHERGDRHEREDGHESGNGHERAATDGGVGDVRTAGSVTLVGVVHDHPASKHRVRSVLEAVDPDALALELPPIAVPLFEQYADVERSPPTFGGEMSTAIQTVARNSGSASADRVVGIDGPTPGFVTRLFRTLRREEASLSTIRGVLDGLRSVTKHAVVCRAAATIARRTSLRIEVDSPVDHDADWHDDPERQAADEQAQVDRAEAVLDAFEPSRASRFRDATREAHMADRLAELRGDGDVVAVVGIDHLDGVASKL